MPAIIQSNRPDQQEPGNLKSNSNITGLMPGVDVKSDRGYIVVYPSVHPDTGKDYVWLSGPERGIADAPKWLFKMIQARTPELRSVTTQAMPPSSDRMGQRDELLATIIDRFPITGYGQRNGQMVRAIGRLIGQNYNRELVAAVVEGWWEHFDALGVIRTPPTEARKEIEKCITTTLNSKSFRQADRKDHRAGWARIQVCQEQSALIREAVVGSESESNTLLLTNSTRVKKRDRLCRTPREVALVEAMVVYFTYKVHHLHESPLQVTRKDLCQLMEDRHGLTFDNRQYEDDKLKYVSRPGKPATRFELAVQTVEGHQRRASQYQLTGLLQLMPPAAV